MIRVYVALYFALGTGLGISAAGGPIGFIGEVLSILAAIGLHAHYTSER